MDIHVWLKSIGLHTSLIKSFNENLHIPLFWILSSRKLPFTPCCCYFLSFTISRFPFFFLSLFFLGKMPWVWKSFRRDLHTHIYTYTALFHVVLAGRKSWKHVQSLRNRRNGRDCWKNVNVEAITKAFCFVWLKWIEGKISGFYYF